MANSTVTEVTNMSNVTTASALETITGQTPLWETVFLGIVLVVVVTFTVLGNLVVIIAFVVEKKLRTTFTMYIINLAITDFSVGITAMTFFSIDNMLGYWPFGEAMCGVWIFMDYAMTFASVFTLVAISLDRYWSVCWSLHYRRNNTKRKTAIMLVGVWLLVLIIWTPACIVDRIKYSIPGVCRWEPSNNMEFVIVLAVIGHHSPCFIMTYCYLKVFLLMREKARKIASWRTGHQPVEDVPTDMEHSYSLVTVSNVRTQVIHENDILHTPQEATTSSQEKNPVYSIHLDTPDPRRTNERTKVKIPSRSLYSKEQKIFMTLSYILISYIICWVPWHFVFDISAADPALVPEIIYKITFWLTYINSTLNPLIYAYSNKDFREAFTNVITCKCIRKLL